MKATESTIRKFLRATDRTYIIPPFQRNYTWDEEQCIELFEDIIKSVELKRPHYLGNIIYYVSQESSASSEEYVLIDGQQRITSLLLLVCAIRDTLDENDEIIEEINDRYLKNDSKYNKYRVKLKQTYYDAESFSKLINCNRVNINEENKIVLNYNLFIKLLKDYKLKIYDIYKSLLEIEIVEIDLKVSDDLEQVQTIFEKINSTGKPLSAADLIRNYLLISRSNGLQDELYNNYWIKIEENLKNDNISIFARDFLIMSFFIEITKANIYKDFKSSFKEKDKKEILEQMEIYSRYYSWLIYENCPNEKINRKIIMLNILKTSDVYPLYLLLLKEMYSKNENELEKIFDLLIDYLLRYRIVQPSSGGGTLSSVVRDLLKKLVNNEIQISKDDIYFELSNSSTIQGRYPNDEEFKNKLMSELSNEYARVLFLKIEEFETKNVPVDIKLVSIEHILPQTLSNEWEGYLEGKENAERISDNYLQCIGNLTPVSKAYNSKMSNKLYNEKKESLKDVQFKITNTIINRYDEWNEESIVNRNEKMANLANRAILGPLQRTRPVKTKSNLSYIPGKYAITDLITDMSGSKPVIIYLSNKKINCNAWKNLVAFIVTELEKIDSVKLDDIISRNLLHKATSKKNTGGKDPIITKNYNHLTSPVKIENTPYFCEGNFSNYDARKFANELLSFYELENECFIEIT